MTAVSASVLGAELADLLRDLGNRTLSGTVVNVKTSARGITYFRLVDAIGAYVQCHTRAGQYGDLVEGERVVVTGPVEVYMPKSAVQLVVASLRREGVE